MPEQQPFTIAPLSGMERNGDWTLVRRSLGVESFGLNVVEIAEGASIPEHDESGRDQEEVFMALAGSPLLVIDGEEHPLPKGTLARLAPEPRRTVRNPGPGVARLLIISAPTSSGYVGMSWA